MKRIVFKDHDDLYRHAADLFAQQANLSIQRAGRFVVLLSGGATPLPLYRRLTQDPWRSQIDWQNVFVGWSDERCVPPNHEASNFRTAKEALLSHVPIPDNHVFRIEGENDPTSGALAYETQLRALLGQESGADLALLGLGTDGHTASLFPANPALQEDERWFVPVHVPEMAQPWRVTATLSLLNGCKKVVFLVTGQEKTYALARIRNGMMLPAGLIRPQNGSAVWLVDQASSSQSEKNA